MRFVTLFLFLKLSLLSSILALGAKEKASNTVLKGPDIAELIKVIDGDTILVNAFPWPRHSVKVYVRLRDIDAPELRSKCAIEKSDAYAAKQALEGFLNNENLVLYNISGGKYYGRVIASIKFEQNKDSDLENKPDVGTLLLKKGLVFPYKDRRKFRHKYIACANS